MAKIIEILYALILLGVFTLVMFMLVTYFTKKKKK